MNTPSIINDKITYTQIREYFIKTKLFKNNEMKKVVFFLLLEGKIPITNELLNKNWQTWYVCFRKF